MAGPLLAHDGRLVWGPAPHRAESGLGVQGMDNAMTEVFASKKGVAKCTWFPGGLAIWGVPCCDPIEALSFAMDKTPPSLGTGSDSRG